MSDSQLNTVPDAVQERWLPVGGFPGYEVSDFGQVRSFWKQIFPVPGGGCDWIIDRHPQRILKPRSDRDKYSIAYLYKNGKSFIHKVHRLVLLTFVGPCPPGMQACHNNGNPFDNYPSNLRWDTISANQFDSIKHGTAKSLKQNGMANHQAKLTEQQVIQIRNLFTQGYSNTELGKMFSVDRVHIWNIVNRKRWPHLP